MNSAPIIVISYSKITVELLSIGLSVSIAYGTFGQLLINPKLLVEIPNKSNIQKEVQVRSTRAMGIFAVVLAVISFILSGERSLSHLEWLSLTSTVFAAGLLMTAFILETIGSLTLIIYYIQESALELGGLLLFLGLFLLVESADPPLAFSVLLGISVIISWGIWFVSYSYGILIVERKNWDESMSRCQYIVDLLKG